MSLRSSGLRLPHPPRRGGACHRAGRRPDPLAARLRMTDRKSSVGKAKRAHNQNIPSGKLRGLGERAINLSAVIGALGGEGFA